MIKYIGMLTNNVQRLFMKVETFEGVKNTEIRDLEY